MVCLAMALMILPWGASQSQAQSPTDARVDAIRQRQASRITTEQRLAAAERLQQQVGVASVRPQATPLPGGTPNYFGPEPNWTNSPPMRKFVDLLPGLGPTNANNLGQYIPVAVPNTSLYPGCDYYEIELREYTERMHSDLIPTKLRGYVQVVGGVPVAPIHYLGPIIMAQKNRPVRVKFTNKLPIGAGGNLFLPVDTTIMGSGMGPVAGKMYTQNRATLHLHGGATPWISDGTPHQWTVPAGETTPYPKGVAVQNVPDMPTPGPGSLTFFYSNQQSARLMFYHDHSFGITRLNVYAGEAAPYLLQDTTEANLVSSGVLPPTQIPLVIQDKTFVPRPPALVATDPTWNTAKWGGFSNLWFPHVYMPNQNPNDIFGASPIGRWDYGPWVPFQPSWPVANNPITLPSGLQVPNVPNVSAVPEAFMDTPVINGTAYPICRVQPQAYRFRILNASNDRYWNLGIYFAKSNTPDTVSGTTGLPLLQTNSGEVSTVPSIPGTWPAYWGTPDGRNGGVPDPATAGPPIIQIGTEAGFLPAPVVIPSTPTFFDRDTRSVTFGNVKEHGLYLGPAERADVIVDFSQVPVGSRLILYNDAPDPMPMGDYRDDYYTGNPNFTSIGGAPSTLAGFGPNTRTIMQFEVRPGPSAAAYNLAGLQAAFASTASTQGVFARSQDPVLVTQPGYNSAYNATFPADAHAYVTATATSLNFTPLGAATPITINFDLKSIDEQFDNYFGRMNALLGTQLVFTNVLTANTIPYNYIDVPTEILTDNVTVSVPQAGDNTAIWRIVHNGVDTHAIHFHLFNVQVLGRVDAVGIVKPPEPNELGWKETVRMNPLEDCIVALRPVAPKLVFGVPHSVRLLDPTNVLNATGYFDQAQTGFPFTSTQANVMTDYGWEYVWHCHLLGHEENDMMRPMIFRVATTLPSAPVLGVALAGSNVNLTWTDGTPAATALGNPANEVGFRILRARGTNAFSLLTTALANSTFYSDTTTVAGNTYRYKVVAFNPSGSATSNTVTQIR
jgi:FtsP/CotA-like multicopper oxidase with cupredoxin domain